MTTLTMSRPIDETYEDVKRLIYKVVNQFMRRNGGDFDELVSTANEVYLDAHETWKPGSAPFTHYLCICIYRRLIGDWKKSRRLKVVSLTEPEGGQTQVVDKFFDFNREEFYEQLSDEARYVVQLAFSPPEDLSGMIARKGGKVLHYSSTIKEYLRDIGWSRTAIREAWTEVQGILS